MDEATRVARELAAGPEQWDDPVPLGPVGKAKPFPAHRLPGWLNEYVVDVAHVLQVPVDMPAMLSLGVLAAAAGGRAVVEVRSGFVEPLNLYVAIAMDPGERKTPVYQRLVAPLEHAEESLVDRARPDVRDAKIRFNLAKHLADKADQDVLHASDAAREEAINFAKAQHAMSEAITVPTLPRLLADDATPEALTTVMFEQGGRLALFSDEGEVFAMMGGRYSAAGPNLGIYLKAHVGSPIRVDRKGREPEFIHRPALTLGLTVQPEVLRKVSAIEGARGRGLLGRFLWSVPPSMVGSRTVVTAAIRPEVEAAYLDHAETLIRNLSEWNDPAVLVFSPAAQSVFVAFEERVETLLRLDGPLGHIRDWGAKLVGQVARVAGLLHLANDVEEGCKTAVQPETVADAINMADVVFIPHALVAFGIMANDKADEGARAVLGWVRDRAEFTRRDIFHAYQYRFGTVEELEPVLQRLVDHEFIAQIATHRGARTGRSSSPKYIVNAKWAT